MIKGLNQVPDTILEEQDSDFYPEFPIYDFDPGTSATLLARYFDGFRLTVRLAVGRTTPKVIFDFSTRPFREREPKKTKVTSLKSFDSSFESIGSAFPSLADVSVIDPERVDSG